MFRLPRFVLAAGLVAGLSALSPAARAAPASAGLMLGDAMTAPQAGLLEEVRWVNRCRPVVVYRQDRFGRPVRVQRERCRRVWVGPPRGPRYRY